MPFESLPDSSKAFLTRASELNGDEVPIVASIVSDSRWLLATSDRVVFRNDEGVISISLGQLRNVHSASLDDAHDNRDDVLVLVTDTAQHDVHVEPGRPMSGIWNVLRRLQILWTTNERM
jgi:hypothetical protein